MARKRAELIFITIIDLKCVFSPPETPANCTQQQVSAPSINSGDVYSCLHVPPPPKFTPSTPLSHPAPTASKTPYPAPTDCPYPPPATLAAILHVTEILGGGQCPVWIYQPVWSVSYISYKNIASKAAFKCLCGTVRYDVCCLSTGPMFKPRLCHLFFHFNALKKYLDLINRITFITT
jgi:hypothetical protein